MSHWLRCLTAGFSSLLGLVSAPALAQVKGAVVPPTSTSRTGGTLSVSIQVDMGSTGQQLGSYGAVLVWDPLVLLYESDTGGGQPPFDAAVVNNSNVGNGELRFSDAAPEGAGGVVQVLEVTFRVVGEPCQTTLIDLEFTSLFAAQTFDNLQTVLTVQDAMTQITDFFIVLRATGGSSTLLQWNTHPWILSYDLIRGDRRQIFADLFFVHLGTVTCLANDLFGTVAGPDTTLPPLRGVFFYLLRPASGVQRSTYGFTSACARERVVDSGDCP